MTRLAQQRCFNHALREAAARCPGCGQFFCRECITEHDDRVLCAACLAKSVRPKATRRFAFGPIFRLAHFVVAMLVAWFFFFLIGAGLLKLPAQFHEGTLWRANATSPE
jgi:hypothetical protein